MSQIAQSPARRSRETKEKRGKQAARGIIPGSTIQVAQEQELERGRSLGLAEETKYFDGQTEETIKARQLRHAKQHERRKGTVEQLILQGHAALEASSSSPYHADWRLLLERLEAIILNSPSIKFPPESSNSNASSNSNCEDTTFPVDVASDDLPRRLLRELVAYLRVKDSDSSLEYEAELTRYQSLKSRLDKYCRKSMLSTVTANTNSSSPPTMASDQGSTSSLSAPAWEQDLPSPSPLKFTFTRTHSNSFAVDVFADEPLVPSSPTSTTISNGTTPTRSALKQSQGHGHSYSYSPPPSTSTSSLHHRNRSDTVAKPVIRLNYSNHDLSSIPDNATHHYNYNYNHSQSHNTHNTQSYGYNRSRSTSRSIREPPLSSVAIDENHVHESIHPLVPSSSPPIRPSHLPTASNVPYASPVSPTFQFSQSTRPSKTSRSPPPQQPIQSAQPPHSPQPSSSRHHISALPSKHRHSRSLPMLRPQPTQPPPPLPLPNLQVASKTLRPSQSMNAFAQQTHLFLGGGHIPPIKSEPPPRPKPRIKLVAEPENRWTIHQRDSWEVIERPKPGSPLGSPISPLTPAPGTSGLGVPTSTPSSPNSPSESVPTDSNTKPSKPRGLERLRKRISKSHLSIKTGSLSSIANIASLNIGHIGSPARPEPLPVNVNCVVTGPSGCGISTLIQKFITGSNDFIPTSTIDDFWHHVVKSEARTIYYNITEVTGSEEYADLRKAVLRRAQVVMLCFRLDSQTQFRESIVRLAEDVHTIGHIPIILVGTFQDSPVREVTADEAQTAAEALHATYYECSPLLGRGVRELFDHAATVIQVADEVRPAARPPPPSSATRSLFNLVRSRRAFSHSHPTSPNMSTPATPSGRDRHGPAPSSYRQSHYIPHSASAKQKTFAESSADALPVLNIAPGSETTSGPALLLGPIHFKCVIHGGKSSGKKSMVHRYLHNTFEWLPEAPWMSWKAAVHMRTVQMDKDQERRPSLPTENAIASIPYALTISEAASSKSLDGLRRATYNGVNVFVICFSVSDHREEVLKEIKDRWYEECRSYNPNIPIILVATKTDQRAGTLRAWTKAQGQALAQLVRAVAYLECSAATGEGIENVFQTIVRVANETYVPNR